MEICATITVKKEQKENQRGGKNASKKWGKTF
jgi:hypothetical protein